MKEERNESRLSSGVRKSNIELWIIFGTEVEPNDGRGETESGNQRKTEWKGIVVIRWLCC